MAYLQSFNFILASGSVALQFLIVVTVLFLIFKKEESKFLDFLKSNFLPIGFFISLAALLSSLFYSEIIGFVPCKLCWLQRIFLYPQVFLFGMAWIKKDKNMILFYSIPLLIVGALISVYHNFVYYFGEGLAPCDPSGVSCVKRLVNELGGYVSIPMLSLTAFLALATLLLTVYFYKKQIQILS